MNSKAFSLIEILLGLLILGVALLGLAQMQVTSIRGNFFSHYLTQASYVAQDRLEFLNNLPLDSAQLQAGSHNDGTANVSNIAFSRSYSVVTDGGLTSIHYRVTWNDGVGRSISFSTIRSH
jgi:prepilin-type N-terminal cleavage/methylation domain-containing protein